MDNNKTELAVRFAVGSIQAHRSASPEEALAKAFRQLGGTVPQEEYAGALARVRAVLNDAPEKQPQPKTGKENVTPHARREFLRMLLEREAKGLKTYGTTLQTFNGRDVLRDAKEECIDLWQYLCQWELERGNHVLFGLTGIHCPACGAVIHNFVPASLTEDTWESLCDACKVKVVVELSARIVR